MPGYRQRHAPRRAAPPPPPPPAAATAEGDDFRVFLDLLFIGFTISVGITIGKTLASSTADEIIEFVESDKLYFALSLLIMCMMIITFYGYYFYTHKRYEVLVDLALDYVIAAQNQIRQLRSSFFWVRNVMAVFHPSPENFAFVNNVFKRIFVFGMALFTSITGALLCTKDKGDVEGSSVNVVALGLYYVFMFSSNETRFEKLISHLGYIFLHTGALFAYYNFDQIGYVLINSGIALFILCIVWTFVNVPRNQEAYRRKRR